MSTILRKYPRTPHIPGSPGMTDDDKLVTASALEFLQSGVDLVVTEKMDGGNITMYQDAFHGRSLDSGTHPWDTRTRAVWASIRHLIPDGWRVSGESLQARRSVAYDQLPGVYMVFGVWDENNVLLSWKDTVDVADMLSLPHVPVLYEGNNYQDAVTVWGKEREEETSEGFVLRNSAAFPYEKFSQNIAKWVRAGHVRTRADWRHRDDFAENTFIQQG